MLVNAKTKISDLIKYDKKAIDVIASINPLFRKLKNPFLRKLLAPRVNVANAAGIGGVSVNDFLQKLNLNGFEVELNEINTEQESKLIKEIDNLNVMERKNIVEFDVRPILDSGVDPFDAIMSKLKQMNDDQTLLIINTFEPIPLLNILKRKGYEYEVERPEQGIVHTYMRKAETEVKNESVKSSTQSSHRC